MFEYATLIMCWLVNYNVCCRWNELLQLKSMCNRLLRKYWKFDNKSFRKSTHWPVRARESQRVGEQLNRRNSEKGTEFLRFSHYHRLRSSCVRSTRSHITHWMAKHFDNIFWHSFLFIVSIMIRLLGTSNWRGALFVCLFDLLIRLQAVFLIGSEF